MIFKELELGPKFALLTTSFVPLPRMHKSCFLYCNIMLGIGITILVWKTSNTQAIPEEKNQVAPMVVLSPGSALARPYAPPHNDTG